MKEGGEAESIDKEGGGSEGHYPDAAGGEGSMIEHHGYD